MTVKEFEEMRQNTFSEIDNKLKLYKDMYKNGERYFKFSLLEKQAYLYKETHRSENIYAWSDINLDSIINVTNEFKSKYENLRFSSIIISEIEYETETDYDGDIEEIRYSFYTKGFVDSVPEHQKRKIVKDKFKEILKPKSYTASTRDVDCKLMELYKDGVITFEALQKLVYDDCEV